ncbi:hypothetical protein RB531_3627 [Salmonella enterica subsp. enterica serovar Typhimurium]
MGRKRAPGNEWMPKGVFFRPSGYYWKPGGSTENIAPADATKAEVWVAYEKKLRVEKTELHSHNYGENFLPVPIMLIWPQERRKIIWHMRNIYLPYLVMPKLKQ